jgi:DNA-binding phage protein
MKTAATSPIGRSLDQIACELIRSKPGLADLLLQEAVQALLDNEVAAARNMIRQVIKASLGYADLSRRTGTPEKSLVRMFSRNGNPTAANLFAVLAHLQRRAGVRLHVASEKVRRAGTTRPRARRAA